MKLTTIKSEGLAHRSYFLTDQEEAAVIDPRRDCQIYTRLAENACAKIKYILETHQNEDYVVGSLELQNMTDAEIGHSKALAFKYGEHHLSDGDSLQVGSLKLRVLHTPGHTKESLCYAIYTSGNEKEALMVFTGDTLFTGQSDEPTYTARNCSQSRHPNCSRAFTRNCCRWATMCWFTLLTARAACVAAA
jgi:hydroxyacylglutathione hydrolase